MGVTLEQFVQHLTHSRLLSAAEISSFQDSLPPEKRPQDGETLARALVQANKLTKYQAQVVYQGKVKGLVFGDYRVLDKLGQGVDVLLNVDVQGAATVCARAAEDPALARALVTVFLTPSSLAVLETRLRRRGADSPEELARRLGVARQEIAQWRHFQYLIISTTVAEDVRRMEAIIDAERLRQSRSNFTLDG